MQRGLRLLREKCSLFRISDRVFRMFSTVKHSKRFCSSLPIKYRKEILESIERKIQEKLNEPDPPAEIPIKKEEANFIDWVRTYFKAGDGGNGCVSFRREKYIRRGPANGGNGGKGGDIILKTDTNIQSLQNIAGRHHAQPGESGSGKGLHGRNGDNMVVRIPVGTLVKEYFPDKKTTGNLIVDLDKPGMEYVIAKGGYGGRGNSEFSSSVTRTPLIKETGKPGELRNVELELKVLADVGLVGFPNAGKSTLLTALSKATPKIANYPFTTLRPHIGIIEYKDYSQVRVADLPGLIEGAHVNKGLGHQFLKHVERTKALCYVIDVCQENNKAMEDYLILRKEIQLYNPAMLRRPSILVANKIDLPSAKARYLTFLNQFVQLEDKLPIVPLSGKKKANLDQLKNVLHSLVHNDPNNIENTS